MVNIENVWQYVLTSRKYMSKIHKNTAFKLMCINVYLLWAREASRLNWNSMWMWTNRIRYLSVIFLCLHNMRCIMFSYYYNSIQQFSDYEKVHIWNITSLVLIWGIILTKFGNCLSKHHPHCHLHNLFHHYYNWDSI